MISGDKIRIRGVGSDEVVAADYRVVDRNAPGPLGCGGEDSDELWRPILVTPPVRATWSSILGSGEQQDVCVMARSLSQNRPQRFHLNPEPRQFQASKTVNIDPESVPTVQITSNRKCLSHNKFGILGKDMQKASLTVIMLEVVANDARFAACGVRDLCAFHRLAELFTVCVPVTTR